MCSSDLLVENQVGQLHLPVGVVPGVVVNGRTYTVPMCTEEASVVAAASNEARTVRLADGFNAASPTRLVTGQVVVAEPRDPQLSTKGATPCIIESPAKKTLSPCPRTILAGGAIGRRCVSGCPPFCAV